MAISQIKSLKAPLALHDRGIVLKIKDNFEITKKILKK